MNSNMQNGTVFNIQKFCVDDGPGIRTTVFLKGCVLRCAWCHNPEGLDKDKSIELKLNRCGLCGACAKVCSVGCHSMGSEHEFFSKNCMRCGKCIEACRARAISFCGQSMSAEEVIEQVLSDKIFYSSSNGVSGGLTISGGEPMMQGEFVFTLLTLAKQNGIHTCLETSGHCDMNMLRRVSPLVDIFLYDIKETNEDNHKKFTGVTNEKIMQNLWMLNDLNSSILLRCPIIPSLNDRHEHFDCLVKIYKALKNPFGIQLMPYHSLGDGKLTRYGFSNGQNFETPTKEQIKDWNDYIIKKLEG